MNEVLRFHGVITSAGDCAICWAVGRAAWKSLNSAASYCSQTWCKVRASCCWPRPAGSVSCCIAA